MPKTDKDKIRNVCQLAETLEKVILSEDIERKELAKMARGIIDELQR